ncbi:MAG: Ig-like domain-containing protein [Lachnospiraceae bacterium]|nr:Ig-like domain-containing protein [Lachnospiraceae bacterium]
MRRWYKSILSVILTVVFVFGNVATSFAQSDFHGETETASGEGTSKRYEGPVLQDDEDYSVNAAEGSVQDNYSYTETDTDIASEYVSVVADDLETSATETEDEEFATGYIRPDDYRDPDTVEDNYDLLMSSYLESRYVDEDLLNAIPLRNQNPYATCWAMASIGLAEFSLYKQGLNTSPDLSELHLAYFTYNSVADPLGGTTGDQSKVFVSNGSLSKYGGNYNNATNALAGWLGAADEDRLPYSEAANIDNGGIVEESLAFEDTAHLRNMYRVNLRNNPDEVKRLIKKYGAAGISFYALGNTSGATNAQLYNNSTNSYYCYETNSPNHGAMIVGWDDCYSRENFPTDPGSDGAWLVRNSWTTGYYSDKKQYKGYFWMSYMDRSLSNEAIVFDFEKANDYDNNYQYDGSIQSSSSSAVTKGANVFTISSGADGIEELGAVSVATLGTNVDYTVDIYKDLRNPNNPESGTKVANENGTFVYEGYHRVELVSPIEMEKDTVFSVVVTLKDGYIQYEANSSSNRFANLYTSAENGQSFAYEGRAWDDFGNSHKGNLKIKAFTNDIRIGSDDLITEIIFADEPGTGVLTLNKGDTYEVGYIAVPETAGDKRVTWLSADKGIATVDNHGVVTAVAKGRTTITATAKVGGLSRTFDVVVTRNLTGLNITSPAEGKLIAGKTYRLSVEAVPEAADFSENVTWTSSDPDIAAVDENGDLAVSGTGEILLTAEADGVSGTGKYMCILSNPVISASRSGSTVSISIDAVMGANSYVIYRKIPSSSGYTLSTIQSITAVQGQNVYEYSDDITSLDIPMGYLEYEIKASGTGAESRSSIKVTTTVRSYTITYDTGVGTNPASNPARLVDGEKIDLDPPIAPAGYSSIGWYESNFDGYIKSLPLKRWSKPWYTDYTLTAKYKANTYRIRYYPNGGSGSMSDTTAIYGDSVSLQRNSFTRQGSVFDGWNTEPDGKGMSYKNKESILNLTTVNGGIVCLYAQWKTPVTSVGLSESSLTLYTGDTRIITKTVLPQHATVREVQWTSSNVNVASVDSDGVVTALSNGTTTITCQSKDGSGKKATCSVTVKTRVTKVEISAPERLAVGKTYKITPAFNADGVEPSDKILAWSSSDAFVAMITQSGSISAVNAGKVTIKAVSPQRDLQNDDIEGSCDIRVYQPVSSVRFNDKTVSVGGNGTLLLSAAITPAVRDDDPEYQGVSFVSSNPAYLRVEEVIEGTTAKLKANLPDHVEKATVMVTATAKDGSGKSATCTVTVVRPVSAVTVSAPDGQNRIAIGKTLRLTANVLPDQAANKQVEWISSAPNVANVDKNGNVKAITAGNAVITARSVIDDSVSGEYPVQTYAALTGILLNSTSVTVHAGNKYKLDIIPKPVDAVLTDVTYNVTSGSRYINVDNTGLITAMDNLDGKPSQKAIVTVTADDGVNEKTSRCSVTVTKDPVPVKTVKLDRTSLSMGLGAKETIYTSIIPGSADIRELETPAADKPGIVDVTDNGDGSYDIEAIGKGTAVVKFISRSNHSKNVTCRITVGNPVGSVIINPVPTGIIVGRTTTLRATVNGVGGKAANTSVEWKIQSAKDADGNDVSDTSKIATINDNGMVSANSAGTVTIRATAEKPYGIDDTDARYYAECTIKTYIPVSRITAERTRINVRQNGSALVYISAIQPENASDQRIRWISSNENIVKIISPVSATTDTADGDSLEIMAMGIGTAKITGTTTDGSKKSVTVNVKVTGSMKESDVAITIRKIPGNVYVDNNSLGTKNLIITDMPVKKSVTLTPVVTASAGDKKVSFRSSDPNIATVSTGGVVTAKAPGTATVTMRTSDGGFEACCSVKVSKD